MGPRFRRDYDPSRLLAAHPPELRHPNKRTVFELACPPGAVQRGSITVTRWTAAELPERSTLAPTTIVPMPGHFDYAGSEATVWHLNFADPELFFGYGSGLLAQDELQAAEHPMLGPIRLAMQAEGEPALTEQDGAPTPVLVAGVERRCALDTTQLYGNQFAAADTTAVRRAVRVLEPPARSNLIAIAAPACGGGTYRRAQIEQVLVTAYTGFRAAIAETRAPVEIRTGFWGCGAFGGNRQLMTLLQLLAARLAGVATLRFYVFDDRGLANFRAGSSSLERVLGPDSLAELIDRIVEMRYEWGVSDGN